MADVFVSYAHEDRDIVRELVNIFQSDGHSVWWDREVGVGRTFGRQIEKELAAAKAVVVVWSAASVESQWVWSEATYALDCDLIVPVAIDDIKIPLPFNACQTAALTDWPNKRRDLELFKLRQAIDDLTESSVSKTAAADIDNLDPTLSARVATRVAGLLGLRAPTDGRALDFERAVADCATRCVVDGPSIELAEELLDRLKNSLAADSIGLWRGDRCVLGHARLGAVVELATPATE